MKAARAENEVTDEGEVEPWGDMDVEVGEGAVLANWCGDDSEGGDPKGRVGVVVVLAVDALWHLLVFGVGGVRRTLVVGGWCWWERAASGSWWLVLIATRVAVRSDLEKV